MAAEITAELALEIKEFLSGIKKAQSSAGKFSKGGAKAAGGWGAALKKVAGNIVAVGAAALKAAAVVAGLGIAVAGALSAGIKKAFDMGGKFSDLAAQMGATAGQARVLAAAFENNGMTADQVAVTVNKMSKAFNDANNGLVTSKRAFDELGLDPKQLIKTDPVSAFQAVMDALGGVEGESKRVALSMDVFGRAGGKLGVLLKDKKAMENAKALIGGQAKLLDKHAEQFDRASDVLNQVGVKVTGFFVGVGSKIVEQIMPAIEAINKLDLTGIGERFGEALSNALNIAVAIFQVFKGMSLAEIAGLFGRVLMLGIKKAINFFSKASVASFSATVAYLIEGMKSSVAFLGVLTTKDFWSGMLNVLLGIAQVFAGFMLKRISQVITAVKEATGSVGQKIFGDSDKNLAAQGEVLNNNSKDNFAKAGTDLEPAFNVLTERMKKTGEAVAGAYTRTFQNATDLINTSEDEAAIDGFIDQVKDVADVLKKNQKDKKAPETGDAGDPQAKSGGLPAINSRLSGAINTLAGRSANAVIAAEASKTSANTERTAKATEEIAKNTANNNNEPKRTPKPQASGSGRFG